MGLVGLARVPQGSPLLSALTAHIPPHPGYSKYSAKDPHDHSSSRPGLLERTWHEERDGRVSHPSQTSCLIPIRASSYHRKYTFAGTTSTAGVWALGQDMGLALDPVGETWHRCGAAGRCERPVSVPTLRNQQPIKLSATSYICFVLPFFPAPGSLKPSQRLLTPEETAGLAEPRTAGALAGERGQGCSWEAATGLSCSGWERLWAMGISLFHSLGIYGTDTSICSPYSTAARVGRDILRERCMSPGNCSCPVLLQQPSSTGRGKGETGR